MVIDGDWLLQVVRVGFLYHTICFLMYLLYFSVIVMRIHKYNVGLLLRNDHVSVDRW